MSKKLVSLLFVLVMLISVFPATMVYAAPDPGATWRLVDPADVQVGKSYLIVSEYGALTNAQATISTPGDVTGDTQIGMATTPVTIENGLITSEVTDSMIWQFGLGANTGAAVDGLGEGPGYYVLNNAPGAGGSTEPLRRESSFNAQHAPINTTGAAISGNQQSLMMHVLNAAEGTVSLYYWGGNNQWNFALTGTADGYTAKSKAASTTSAAQLLEQMQEAPLKLYELNEPTGVQHYVMASSGANGTISPSSLAGHVWVNDGEDVTFTFTPAFGFEVDTVTVNGSEVPVTDNKYTITNVTSSGTTIHVTFKPDANAAELPFTVYNDIFSVGNVTTAVIIDLGEGNAANLADVSADMFAAYAKNTRLDGTTVIFDGSRNITRAYVNNSPEPLGYISPAPGSDDLVTDTPASGRYIIVEFEFWNSTGYTSGSMVSGNLQNAFSAILNYRINVNREIKLTDGTTITPKLTQSAVVNPALDKFVPDKTNPGGTGSMDILISIDESWKELGPLPLFIYNHGGGRGGPAGDYYAPVQTANGAAVLSKRQLENPGMYNAHIIATQNHANNQANNEALMAYIQKLADEGKVDLSRVYMSGFSMGSMYTIGFYTRNPEFLAAIIPLAGGNLPTEEQLLANPELAKTSIWANVHKNDGAGNTWTNYFSTGAGASGLYAEANVTVLDTNQAFNFPYYGFDWTPHETEAQLFSNRISQSNAFFRYGAGHEAYADKTIFDWMFAQVRPEKGVVNFKLAGPTAVEINDQGEYILSAANMDKVGTMTVWFEVDGAYFSGKSIEGLNGFEVLGDIVWESKGGTLWSGRVTIANYSGGVTSAGFTEVLKLTLNSKEELGSTAVKITRLDVSGYDENNTAIFLEAKMGNDSVPTDVLPHFSKYDINRDGVVDQLDLTTAQLYYAAREGDANWDAAKIADVNEDGRVDIEDLILILNNIVW